MSDVHTLVIKHDGHPLDHEPADIEYSIECPGVTDGCRMWVECDVPACAPPEDVARGEFHGERHQYIASTWSVPTETCYLTGADELCDAADYLATQQELGPGRYRVGHDFDEGMIADLHLVDTPAATSQPAC